MKKILAFLFIFFTLVSFASATTYTVNSGTITATTGFTPSGTLSAGDTLIVPHTWTGGLFFNQVNISGGVLAVKNESGYTITITSAVVAGYGNVYFYKSRNITFDGTNGLTPGSQYGFDLSAQTYAIRIWASEGLSIKGCYMHDNTGTNNLVQYQHGVSNADCPKTYATPDGDYVATGLEFSYNKFENSAWMGGYVGTSSTEYGACDGTWDYGNVLDDVSVHHNIFKNLRKRAWQTGRARDENSNGWSFKFYNNNVINPSLNPDDAWAGGLHASGFDEISYIYNNWFDMRGTSPICTQVINADSRKDDADAENEYYIYNNVVWEDKSTSDYGSIAVFSNNSNNRTINNTVIKSLANGGTSYGIYALGGGKVSYNLVVGESGGNSYKIYAPLATAENNATATLISDQYFANAGLGNFRLDYLSPQIDHNTDGLGTADDDYWSVDFDGKSRPLGSYPDPGAFEYSYKIKYASPASGSTGTSVDVVLSWHNPSTEPTVQGYFDKCSEHNPPTTQVITDGANTESYDPPGSLFGNTQYCWRIDLDSVTGDVYTLTTAGVSPPILNRKTTAVKISKGGGGIHIGE